MEGVGDDRTVHSSTAARETNVVLLNWSTGVCRPTWQFLTTAGLDMDAIKSIAQIKCMLSTLYRRSDNGKLKHNVDV